MPGVRSRQGCEECRRRRRKCNERKPTCGQCLTFGRTCTYPLRLVWAQNNGHRENRKALFSSEAIGERTDKPLENDRAICKPPKIAPAVPTGSIPDLPYSLPNGIPLSAKYRRLLSYFTEDILASLSVHPSIHDDFRRGLIPVILQSPQLLSACLALSAAGFVSRGIYNVEGTHIMRIIGHLQSSGLSLLRDALANGQLNETLIATCLIWCLADIFTYRQGSSSWKVHLQGIRALLAGNRAYRYFCTQSGAIQSAMKHLYQLYQSLQTLPFIPTTDMMDQDIGGILPEIAGNFGEDSSPHSRIDGFLGYSEDLLQILQRADQLSSSSELPQIRAEADILLGKVKGMIRRDERKAPEIAIRSPLSPDDICEFGLCHKIFQQATLIYLYRRLYSLPSRSEPIQRAVRLIEEMVEKMSQGLPLHAWVAMAMPLFTIGCEAFTEHAKSFVMAKVRKLEECIGSLHVGMIRQALEDSWKARQARGDEKGWLCASQVLGELRYNIILF